MQLVVWWEVLVNWAQEKLSHFCGHIFTIWGVKPIYIYIYNNFKFITTLTFNFNINFKIYNNFKFHVFHNLQANDRCNYKHSYIKSNSLLLTYQGIAVKQSFIKSFFEQAGLWCQKVNMKKLQEKVVTKVLAKFIQTKRT